MNPQQQPGDYVLIRAVDNDDERADARRILRENGCRSVRFETLADGRLQAHGYVAQMNF